MNMRLLFVYNADSGLLSSLKDTVHKSVSPGTYQCNLCKVTFGPVSMKQQWKEYIASLPHDIEFLHRDEFQRRYPEAKNISLPTLFVTRRNGIETAIPATAINNVRSVEDLIELVSTFLESNKKQFYD